MITAPATPEKIHSKPRVGNTTVLSQGIAYFQVALATMPAKKPRKAKVPIILNLSPMLFHLVEVVAPKVPFLSNLHNSVKALTAAGDICVIDFKEPRKTEPRLYCYVYTPIFPAC